MVVEYARPVRAGVDTLMHVGEDVATSSPALDKRVLIGAALGAFLFRRRLLGAGVGALLGHLLRHA